MSRKNNTIVAIAVHAKLNPGDVFYNAGDGGERITVLTRPYWRSVGGSWWVTCQRDDGTIFEASLADRGFPGFAYDSRPFYWVRTEDEIKSRQDDIYAWRENDLYYDPYYFAVDYYSEPEHA